LLLIISISFGFNGFEEDLHSNKSQKIKVLPLPTFGYEPETKTNLGAVCLFAIDWFDDSLTRQSNAKLEAKYTFRNQLIFEAGWNYFSKKEKWFSDGVCHVSIYPDFYYGVGANTSQNNKLLFSTNRIKADFALYRNLGKQIFMGGGLRYFKYSNVSSDSVNVFQELVNGRNFGVKAAIFKDTRNNLLNATKGIYALLDVEYNISRADYWKMNVDA